MRVVTTALLLCALLMVAPSWAQDASGPAGEPQGHIHSSPPASPTEIEMQNRAAKQRNLERFAKIKKDTDQLLELATQLKKSVDEANDQTLSLEVIRKAEKIEKLAKQVRQKMVGE